MDKVESDRGGNGRRGLQALRRKPPTMVTPVSAPEDDALAADLMMALRVWERERIRLYGTGAIRLHDDVAGRLAAYCARHRAGWFDCEGLRYVPTDDGSFMRWKVEMGPVRR